MFTIHLFSRNWPIVILRAWPLYQVVEARYFTKTGYPCRYWGLKSYQMS